MPGLSLAERERRKEKKEERQKRKKKKKAVHRIEPGATDTKGYQLLHLQTYNSNDCYSKTAWGEH